MRSHSSCLFHTGQSLLVDFDLCAFTRLVFFTLASHCWWTLAWAFPLIFSFLTLVNRCWWTLACALPTELSFLTLVRRCWRTLTCALPLVLSFLTLFAPFCRLSRVIQPTTGWGYTFFRTVAAKKQVGLCVPLSPLPPPRRRRRRYGKSLIPTFLHNPTIEPTKH